jgi:hypothetical protein
VVGSLLTGAAPASTAAGLPHGWYSVGSSAARAALAAAAAPAMTIT